MSTAIKEYWGYLIKPDKSPTPLFEELLLGIAHYIRKHIAPWEIRAITPPKLAAFYRLVGGNFDSLFLDSPDHSIAFVYKSLGCFHSLEPNKDPFASPSVPALTPAGYVRWQTVQLLLEPDVHVPFLQEAVKRFEIINPADGETFPRTLPAEALPKRPDPGMCTWEAGVREKLRAEAELPTPRGGKHASRPSDVESLPDSQTSIDDRSIVDAAEYFQPTPKRPHSHGHPASPMGRGPPPTPMNGETAPQNQERRRSNVERNIPTPTYRHPYPQPGPTSNPAHRHHHRGRLPSISTNSSFATTRSSRSRSRSRSESRSRSPPIRPSHHRNMSHSQSPGRYAQAPARPSYDAHGRRHSAHGTYPIRGAEPVPPLPQQSASKRDSLSPHFFAPSSQNGRPTTQTGPGAPPPSGYTLGSGPIPAANPMQPIPTAAQPGAFARGPLRASTGHAYRGDWHGRQDMYARHPSQNGHPLIQTASADTNGVRFQDGEISPRSDRMRRRTMEEMAREHQREELDFEKARRRSRHNSSETKARPRGDKYL